MLLVLVILILLFVLWKMGLGAGSREFAMGMFMRTKHKLNITAIMMQIATTMSYNLSIAFPLIFTEFLGAFNFININPFQVIAFDCVGSFNFYDTLLGMTLMPLAICGLLMGQHGYMMACGRGDSSALSWMLIFLFFVMPTVSSTIFNVYKCRYFEDSDEWMLVADYSIKCEGKNRTRWLFYASAQVLVYPMGITTLFGVLLYRARGELGPKDAHGNPRPWQYYFFHDDAWEGIMDEETGRLVQEPSHVGDSTRHLAFLTEQYTPRTFWFVVPENTRRLLLSSALIVFAVGSNDAGTAPQAVAALLLCVVGIKVYHYYTPFVHASDDQFSELAQWVLASMFLAALMARVQAMDESSESQEKIGILLILVVLSAFGVLFWFIVKEVRNEVQKGSEIVRRLSVEGLKTGGDESTSHGAEGEGERLHNALTVESASRSKAELTAHPTKKKPSKKREKTPGVPRSATPSPVVSAKRGSSLDRAGHEIEPSEIEPSDSDSRYSHSRSNSSSVLAQSKHVTRERNF
jgi:hypothetical protein